MASLSVDVLLSIQCANLKDMDVFSKSDPCVFVSLKERGHDFEPIGRTELIKDNLNPQFQTSIRLSYFFEMQQYLKFMVYDIDSPTVGPTPSPEDDFIGSLEVRLGTIMGSRTQSVTQDLAPAGVGSITISLEECQAQSVSTVRVGSEFQERLLISASAEGEVEGEGEVDQDPPGVQENLKKIAELQSLDFPSPNEEVPWVRLCLRGERLKKMDLFGKSDPYFKIFRTMQGQETFQLVNQSERIMKTLNPVWQPLELEMAALGGLERKLRIEVWDWDRITSDDLIGSVDVSLGDFVGATEQEPHRFELKFLKNLRKKNRGFLVVTSCVEFNKIVVNAFPHLKFPRILREIEINLYIAVDFTASNIHPSSPSSLHYTGGRRPNQYEEAISAIGTILQDYDSDQLFPVLGFGGKYCAEGESTATVSHCFPLNGNDDDAECRGLEGVLEAYRKAIRTYALSGGTKFHHVIDHVIKNVREDYNPKQFAILLILSDGEIDDMAATKRSIIVASRLPIAIIIVGVGKCDFAQMVELDGDDALLKQGLSVAKADIVQFVPFREFAHDGVRLSEETLREIPFQIVSFYDRLERGETWTPSNRSWITI